MKKFLIKVNGNQYEVEVEEIRKAKLLRHLRKRCNILLLLSRRKKDRAKTKAKPEPAPAKTAAAVLSAETVKAPIPGTVLKIEVKKATRLRRAMFSFYLRQ